MAIAIVIIKLPFIDVRVSQPALTPSKGTMLICKHFLQLLAS